MARTWKSDKNPSIRSWTQDPRWWRKLGNRIHRHHIKHLIRNERCEEIPTSFDAHWKRDSRGWYW